MSTSLLVPFLLPLFFVRDFFLLRMGPRFKTAIRLRSYSLALVASMILGWAVWKPAPGIEYSALDHFLLPVMFLYGSLCAISIWARMTDRHNLAWLIAAVPNPLLALGLALLARPILPQSFAYVFIGSIFAAFLWIGLMTFCVIRVEDSPMDAPDLDFSLVMAAGVNVTALLIVPLQGFAVRIGNWNDLLGELAGMFSPD